MRMRSSSLLHCIAGVMSQKPSFVVGEQALSIYNFLVLNATGHEINIYEHDYFHAPLR